jgi:glycosyltransferase involved in cell wall biosynthesis
VLGVGNLVVEKAFDVLVHAISKTNDLRLLLVGEGPLRNSLQSLASAVAPGRVEFRPNMPQADLRFAYSACDVLGLPSLREGWPNVVLEAIACGTPVVASRVGGVPEILADEAPAMLLETREPGAWAGALALCIGAGHEPSRVRDYALQFGWTEVVAKQCALYEQVIDRATTTSGPAR